jgi:dihydropteroate synthase
MHTWTLRDRVLAWRHCLVMGVVNVTPDSFSDGGLHAETGEAVAHGLDLIAQGADLVDVGGESTRPGSQPVALDEELARVVPVVEALVRQGSVPISVDTSKAEVARACLEAGAHIINDVTALTGDPQMAEVACRYGAAVILMHMQGTPQTMQIAPTYADVVVDIYRYFEERLQSLAALGLDLARLVIDPGIGFGKTLEHNLELIANLHRFLPLGRPICLGVSRKGLISKVVGGRPIAQRLAGSLAIACHALAHGSAQVLRVHDVGQTCDVVRMWQALSERVRHEGVKGEGVKG